MTTPTALITAELTVSEAVDSTKTYRLADDKIQGHIDGIDALEQFIHKVLNTEKYEYPIYSFAHGIELDSLMGKDAAYVRVELQRRIRECLLQDERIKSVDNFEHSTSDDGMICTFDVASIYGTTTITKEVNT